MRIHEIRRDSPLVDGSGLPRQEGVEMVINLNELRRRLGGSLPTYATAELPAVSKSAGCRAFVDDSSVTTFLSVVAGGGSNYVPVFCDGTVWRIG